MDWLIAFGLVLLLSSLAFIQIILSPAKTGRQSDKLPPGPKPLPIIGNLHQLGQKPHQTLAELAKVHGPIMSLKLGRITTVVISSSSLAKQVLQKQDLAFSSRHIPDALHAHNQFKFSVVWLPVAARWRSIRKVMTANIFSGNRLDANRHLRSKKVRELVAYIEKSSETGEAVDIGQAAFRTSLNLLSNTIFSKDLIQPIRGDTHDEDGSAKEFKELVGNIMVEAGKPNLSDYFPVLRRLDPQGIRGRMTFYFGKILEMFGGLINQRMELRKVTKADGSADVLDLCLNLCQESPEEIDALHVKHMFLDLFVAGTDTTSSTLEWAMTEVLRDPNVMAKAKMEIELVIGKGKMIEEVDISLLPYLQCIVKETLRLHAPVPFLIPRKVESDVEVNGYIVPKASQVLVNVWAIGRDPSDWEDPLAFKPERFMTSERDVRGQDFEVIPFGAGRRICPGLPLAIRMIPVMLGTLINMFDWKVDGPKAFDMGEKFGITLQKAHPLRAVPIPLKGV